MPPTHNGAIRGPNGHDYPLELAAFIFVHCDGIGEVHKRPIAVQEFHILAIEFRGRGVRLN